MPPAAQQEWIASATSHSKLQGAPCFVPVVSLDFHCPPRSSSSRLSHFPSSSPPAVAVIPLRPRSPSSVPATRSLRPRTSPEPATAVPASDRSTGCHRVPGVTGHYFRVAHGVAHRSAHGGYGRPDRGSHPGVGLQCRPNPPAVVKAGDHGHCGGVTVYHLPDD